MVITTVERLNALGAIYWEVLNKQSLWRIMKRTVLLYGTHRMEEVDLITAVFDRYGVVYTLSVKKTNRGRDYYYVQGMVYKTEEELIRSTIKETTKRMTNFGKMSYHSPLI